MLTICGAGERGLRRRLMDNEPWQRRAKDAGLSQVTLARLLGRPVNTISRQIRGENGGVPQHLIAVIVAWEMMTPEQREQWMSVTRRASGLND
jgi:hypothetical protein